MVNFERRFKCLSMGIPLIAKAERHLPDQFFFGHRKPAVGLINPNPGVIMKTVKIDVHNADFPSYNIKFLKKVFSNSKFFQPVHDQGPGSRLSDIISAISFTLTVDSFSLFLTPSVIIVMQNGHATAMVVAPVRSPSSPRPIFISFLPFSASF